VRERDRARFVFARERVRAIVYEHQVLVMKRKVKSEKNERVRTFSRVVLVARIGRSLNLCERT